MIPDLDTATPEQLHAEVTWLRRRLYDQAATHQELLHHYTDRAIAAEAMTKRLEASLRLAALDYEQEVSV